MPDELLSVVDTQSDSSSMTMKVAATPIEEEEEEVDALDLSVVTAVDIIAEIPKRYCLFLFWYQLVVKKEGHHTAMMMMIMIGKRTTPYAIPIVAIHYIRIRSVISFSTMGMNVSSMTLVTVPVTVSLLLLLLMVMVSSLVQVQVHVHAFSTTRIQHQLLSMKNNEQSSTSMITSILRSSSDNNRDPQDIGASDETIQAARAIYQRTKSAFERFDLNGDGGINNDELEQVTSPPFSECRNDHG